MRAARAVRSRASPYNVFARAYYGARRPPLPLQAAARYHILACFARAGGEPSVAGGRGARHLSHMAYARVAIRSEPIDPQALMTDVADASRGAICTFIGTVRATHGGRAVTGLQYDCYEAMAERELEEIVAEAQRRFGGPAIVAEHRVGTLGVGEISVAIAAAHERRANAIGAMQHVIEELKKRLPIWKLEHYADGTREWVNAGAPPAVAEVGA
jgi:molybdopterin synthase catalytic subunit